MNIYVSNLSFNVHEEDLREFFTPFGEVTSAKIINDRETGRSRGFGFVEMSDDAAAANAIKSLDGGTVDGRTIRVTEARPKESNSSGNSYKSKSPFKRDNNRW
ncbi:MAG: RNA-binding protein [Chitinophagaceae bacterium]|nr:RNA-binding protein [Chitinophagaceae bacterium]